MFCHMIIYPINLIGTKAQPDNSNLNCSHCLSYYPNTKRIFPLPFAFLNEVSSTTWQPTYWKIVSMYSVWFVPSWVRRRVKLSFLALKIRSLTLGGWSALSAILMPWAKAFAVGFDIRLFQDPKQLKTLVKFGRQLYWKVIVDTWLCENEGVST